MKIQFQIGPHTYEVRKPTIRDYYKIRQELAFSETPGFFLLSLLSGCPDSELRRLDIDQFEMLWDEFQIFYAKENETTVFAPPVIELNGKEYGLIQMDKMTIGEFADLDILLNSDKVESRLHEILAVLYREVESKKGEKYVLSPYDLDSQKERAEQFLDLPVSYARGIMGFFLLSEILSIKATAEFLEADPEMKNNLYVQELLKILKKLLEPGSPLWSFLPAEMQSKSTEHLYSQSTQLSTSSSSNTTKPKKWSWNVKNLLKNISLN
jgi:hypothetical protein